jgi:hypothetical protein
MKSVRITWLAALAVGITVGAWAANRAWATHCTTTPANTCTENVRGTKHNLAANTDTLSSGTTEVCVFCHTPHGGRTDVAGGGAPLWNRALSPTTVGTGTGQFQMYGSPNFDGGGDVSTGPKGVSLACLSCHDGTIALDALINAPGSGGFNVTNKNTITDPLSSAARLDSISFNSGPGVDATESLNDAERPSTTTGGGFTGGLADFVGGPGMAPFPNLGRDLTNDHPISMRMPSGAIDPQFDDAMTNSPAAQGNIRSIARAGTVVPADKRDQVRLYNSDATTIDWVECASCHNPHTPRTTFLRLPSLASAATGTESPAYATGATGARDLNHEPNQGSLICLTCHQK